MYADKMLCAKCQSIVLFACVQTVSKEIQPKNVIPMNVLQTITVNTISVVNWVHVKIHVYKLVLVVLMLSVV